MQHSLKPIYATLPELNAKRHQGNLPHAMNNDDELDELIRETQNIWKSLANSGVELKEDTQVKPYFEQTQLISKDITYNQYTIGTW